MLFQMTDNGIIQLVFQSIYMLSSENLKLSVYHEKNGCKVKLQRQN